MEVAFKSVVERIFSNWTALKLAVDHHVGGHEVAKEVVNYITDYCVSDSRIEIEEIQEALEDIMDDEFDTICEDDSPKEIAHILYKFMQLLRDDRQADFQNEYNNLPELKEWLIATCPQQQMLEDSSSSDDDVDVSQVQPLDTEWTEVKSRRRK